jgi:hypothetical protein
MVDRSSHLLAFSASPLLPAKGGLLLAGLLLRLAR